MSKPTYPVPDWVGAYAQDVRQLLGIGDDWHIWIDVVDRPDDSDEADGCCDLDANYLKAKIEIRYGIDTKERVKAVVMHELMHVALAPISLAFDRTLDFMPKQKLNVHVRMLMSDATEQTIERMTRALQTNIKQKKQK